MESKGESTAVAGSDVRQRLPQQPAIPQKAESVEAARQAVVDLNAAEEKAEKSEKDKKTFGRTPNGTVFTVPETHDMVSQLFSPTEPKNISDAVVILVLALHISLLLLPKSLSIPLFAIIYICWRISYNAGIGFVLWHQSNNNALVNWAKRTGIFNDPAKGNNQFPQSYTLLKREMQTKIPKDYKFDDAPIEYNTWLLFRRVVDLILMCDFTSYCCFAAACGGTPQGESFLMTVARWIIGILLVLFNLWVKLDAHRVVKDFAWYWGDFFFLIDQELTFDGVFEMAPHPMYSVGYAGYYGISLMAASYRVLFISIFAHAAQFAFLAFVENPHIEKTYNPPQPRQRLPEAAASELDKSVPTAVDESLDQTSPSGPPESTPRSEPTHIRNLIGIENFDMHRVVDVSAVLLQLYVYTMAFLTPSTPLYQAFFVIHAAFWRLWYSIGIGYILDRQSKKKAWTRHWIKYGETTEEAWRQWKGFYHLSMTMCYVSFVTAAIKMYHLPPDWTYGMSTLRHVIGMGLISLQVWTFFGIYESLGEFGWFFGDFFYEHGPKLTYSGIYRFLNNPERVIGLAGVWGFALITWSKSIFFLALLSHSLTLCFIQFVERPHMQKRYGLDMRQNSGLSKSLKRAMPGPLQKWHSSMDKAIDDAADQVDEFLEAAKPKLAASLDAFVNDTHALFRRYNARMNITRLDQSLNSATSKGYSLEIEGTVSSLKDRAVTDKISGREGEQARMPSFRGSEYQPVILEYGAPIKVRWTAPIQHSKRDWVGLYMIADNASREVTRVSSQGRWVATTRGAYDNARAEQGIVADEQQAIKWEGATGIPQVTGELSFAGDKLWWTTGVFEFRYHHAGMHNVLAVSRPFEIRIGRFEDADGAAASVERAAVEQTLLPLVRNCFDRDPEIAPRTVDEAFGALVEREGKFARRVVFAVWQMFGIELAPSVVKADGNVRNLAWRICNAKSVLAPYSMSVEGSSTPPLEAKA